MPARDTHVNPLGKSVEKRQEVFKTQMCRYYARGRCKRYGKCTFAHSEDEARPQLDLFKTRLCVLYWRHGRCLAGEECRFAHGSQEIRAPLPVEASVDVPGQSSSPRLSVEVSSLIELQQQQQQQQLQQLQQQEQQQQQQQQQSSQQQLSVQQHSSQSQQQLPGIAKQLKQHLPLAQVNQQQQQQQQQQQLPMHSHQQHEPRQQQICSRRGWSQNQRQLHSDQDRWQQSTMRVSLSDVLGEDAGCQMPTPLASALSNAQQIPTATSSSSLRTTVRPTPVLQGLPLVRFEPRVGRCADRGDPFVDFLDIAPEQETTAAEECFVGSSDMKTFDQKIDAYVSDDASNATWLWLATNVWVKNTFIHIPNEEVHTVRRALSMPALGS